MWHLLVGWNEHYADLKQKLVELRPLVSRRSEDVGITSMNSMKPTNFEVALHALCYSAS